MGSPTNDGNRHIANRMPAAEVKKQNWSHGDLFGEESMEKATHRKRLLSWALKLNRTPANEMGLEIPDPETAQKKGKERRAFFHILSDH